MMQNENRKSEGGRMRKRRIYISEESLDQNTSPPLQDIEKGLQCTCSLWQACSPNGSVRIFISRGRGRLIKKMRRRKKQQDGGEEVGRANVNVHLNLPLPTEGEMQEEGCEGRSTSVNKVRIAGSLRIQLSLLALFSTA